jgi:hypothetical protein
VIEIKDECLHWWPGPKKWRAWQADEGRINVQRFGWSQAEARLKVLEFFMGEID